MWHRSSCLLTEGPSRQKTTAANIEHFITSNTTYFRCRCRAEGPPPHRRERLPTPKQKEKSVSLWAILKEVVGKDLSKVPALGPDCCAVMRST